MLGKRSQSAHVPVAHCRESSGDVENVVVCAVTLADSDQFLRELLFRRMDFFEGDRELHGRSSRRSTTAACWPASSAGGYAGPDGILDRSPPAIFSTRTAAVLKIGCFEA